MEGESVTLECRISAYPAPTVAWYREDYHIESSIDFQITFEAGVARLVIREAFAEDSGKFTCTASNEAGSVSTSCYLLVQGKYGEKWRADFLGGWSVKYYCYISIISKNITQVVNEWKQTGYFTHSSYWVHRIIKDCE